uniref:CDK2 associated cullin domain 1 n=1 Tax=Pongo abelii TaxID=9601 RepID=A0A8I5TF04_PONAB
MPVRTRRASLLGSLPAEAGRTAALLRGSDSQLPPLLAPLSRGQSLAPRALLAAPPAALSNCLLEAAVKCREERRCFTAASPRLEPRSAHRRQPRLQASRPRGERETLRTAVLSAAPIAAPGDASPPDLYIERFNIALGQYMGALQSIVPLFIYMNKFYIETKLNRDLKDDLIKLFTEHVAEKHIYSLMPLLLEAQSTPFQVTPSTMANIVKGLYTLRPGVTSPGRELGMSWLITARQHVQVPGGTDSECIEYAFLPEKRKHWSCRDCIQSTVGAAHTQELCHKAVRGRGCWTSYLVCNLKQKLKKNTKTKKMLLLDLGVILKWDNLLMSLSTDSVRKKHLRK